MKTHTLLLGTILTAVGVVALCGCGSTNPISPSAPSTVAIAPAPVPQGTYTVSGVVSEVVDGVTFRLEGVHVEDSQTHNFVVTGEDGSYTIHDVEPYAGTIHLYAAKSGYHPASVTFAPGADERQTMDIQLVRE